MINEKQIQHDVAGANRLPTIQEVSVAYTICAMEVGRALVSKVRKAGLSPKLQAEFEGHIGRLAMGTFDGENSREDAKLASRMLLRKLDKTKEPQAHLYDKLLMELRVIYELGQSAREFANPQNHDITFQYRQFLETYVSAVTYPREGTYKPAFAYSGYIGGTPVSYERLFELLPESKRPSAISGKNIVPLGRLRA